jgi:hypothetical protein
MTRSGEEIEKQFYEAVGRGVAKWQAIERAIAGIYLALIRGEIDLASAAFFQITGFGTRVAMVEAAATLALKSDSRYAELEALLKKARTASKYRNMLVHLEASVDKGSSEDEWLIGPWFYDVRANKKKEWYTVADIRKWTKHFEELGDSLNDCWRHLPKRRRF